jgi:trk system potassium uptake protein TrkH
MVGWMGGFLTLMTAIAILAPMNLAGFEVLRPMGASDAVERAIASSDPSVRIYRFTTRLFPIYLSATLLLWLGLAVIGTPPYPAAMLAMSTLSTSGIVPVGGLADLNVGIGAEMLIFVFLILSVSRQTLMNDFNRSLIGRLRADREVRIATIFVILVPLFLFLRHWIGALEVNYEADILAGLHALWGSVFSVLSFMTTTGFVSSDWDAAQAWSGLPTPGLIFAGLAIVGGGVATTAGGVKLLRVYALYKHGTREMERLVHPSSIGSAGVLGRNVRRQGAVIAWLFFMLFAISIALITIVLTFTGIDFERATIFAISALSNTGPLVEISLDDNTAYNDLRTVGKSVLLVAMVLGRLEMLAIIALFNPDFWRR